MYIHTKPWSRVKWWLAIQAASISSHIHTYILGLQMLAQEYYAAETQGEAKAHFELQWHQLFQMLHESRQKLSSEAALLGHQYQRDLGFVLSRSTGKQHQKLLPASIEYYIAYTALVCDVRCKSTGLVGSHRGTYFSKIVHYMKIWNILYSAVGTHRVVLLWINGNLKWARNWK